MRCSDQGEHGCERERDGCNPGAPCKRDRDVVFVDEATLLEAQLMSGCERCSPDAENRFDQVLDAITGCDPAITEYVICHAAKCPLAITM
jgi:hypothetical protein